MMALASTKAAPSLELGTRCLRTLHTTSRLAPLNRRDRRDRTTRDKGRTASASVATNRIGRQRGRDSRSVRVASGGGEGGGFDGKIKDLNAEHGVVIYSKSWCPFCR